MKTLLTGFEPFGSLKVNSSQLVVEALANRAAASKRKDLTAEVLPTEFVAAGNRIRQLIRLLRPDLIVCLGVNSALSGIHVERIALNLDDADAPDNAGLVRKGESISDAPLAYSSTLPMEEIRDHLLQRAVPVAISNHAGTFVCNHIFYQARHEVELLQLRSRCGFIHLPSVLETKPTHHPALGLPLDTLIEAVESILDLLGKDT